MRSIREQLIRSLCTWPGESQARVSLVSVDKFAPSFANPIRILPSLQSRPVDKKIPRLRRETFSLRSFGREIYQIFTIIRTLSKHEDFPRIFERAGRSYGRKRGREGGRNRERGNRITHPCRVIGNSRARASLNLAEWRG